MTLAAPHGARALWLLLACTRLAAAPDATAITASALACPAAAQAVAPAFATGPDGAIWLSWVERGAAGAANRVCASRFDPTAQTWTPPETIAADATVTPNPADVPQLAIDGSGRLLALWTDGHGGARLSTSTDQGATWTPPQPWVRDGHEVEKFSLARLADGRLLAVWLDGRAHHGAGGTQRLYGRIVGQPDSSDQLIDPSVCDCCQTSLAPFLDGGARVAYRGRTADDVRDILTARFRANAWEEPRGLNPDGWQVNACPVNGPRLSTDGSRVTAAWFTGADNTPRVLASFSPDAGERWLMPLRIDRGHPVGHVDTLLLRDSSFLVSWLEGDGSVWLCRVSPDFAVNGELELAGPHGTVLAGMPRLALLRDYAGGTSGAEVLVAFARASGPGGLQALRVVVPEGRLLQSERNCDCLPTPEQLSGFSIRGEIVGAAAGTVSVRHGEVPGVFPAGEHAFAMPSDAGVAPADAGRPFLGRIERRAGHWTLYDVRFLGAPAEPTGARSVNHRGP